jgi:RimJ/RimL family protein N-acetyltransferase
MAGRPWVEPVTLEGRVVRLEPLSLDHLPGLIGVGLDSDIWRWMPSSFQTAGDMRTYIEKALTARELGTEMPFATVERSSGQVVGGTRYMNIEPHHRRLEIGYTWLAPTWQRTALNTEAKLLMLTHAFNVLGALRVEFKTDSLNEKSRTALLGIGAKEEGTLRNHMVTDSGRRRHSVYFSVIEEEWPNVRQHLESRLARLMRAAEPPDRPSSPTTRIPDLDPDTEPHSRSIEQAGP